ncbi:hypothetical protein PVAND_002898 [Polypedilum vanderplanki]|uniref:Uncharacterized protein n=1 Tax=Polypedilum vanderplanki TaxID=319348 RepID=A0A9J6BU36_POLVA|nr:hypothetical protein PVAND_002898 [Polypedilum vanderplanki]
MEDPIVYYLVFIEMIFIVCCCLIFCKLCSYCLINRLYGCFKKEEFGNSKSVESHTEFPLSHQYQANTSDLLQTPPYQIIPILISKENTI